MATGKFTLTKAVSVEVVPIGSTGFSVVYYPNEYDRRRGWSHVILRDETVEAIVRAGDVGALEREVESWDERGVDVNGRAYCPYVVDDEGAERAKDEDCDFEWWEPETLGERPPTGDSLILCPLGWSSSVVVAGRIDV